MPKCKHCKQPYTRTHGIQTWCSVECGLALARAKQEKQRSAECKAMKRALLDSDRAHWIKKAQSSFNAYIRARDAGLPCISCGCPDGKGKRNAGHYRPAGINTALRFDERNCNGQCERCNTYLSGNIAAYRDGLVKKIGITYTQQLDDNHDIRKWTIPELKEIERTYKAKLKELQGGH